MYEQGWLSWEKERSVKGCRTIQWASWFWKVWFSCSKRKKNKFYLFFCEFENWPWLLKVLFLICLFVLSGRYFMISGLKGFGVKDLTQYLVEQACNTFDYAKNFAIKFHVHVKNEFDIMIINKHWNIHFTNCLNFISLVKLLNCLRNMSTQFYL